MNSFLIPCAVQISGTDGILLGAETLRGLYPVDAVSTVGRICAEVCIYLFVRKNCNIAIQNI
jgi:pyruvate kinase